MKGSRGGRDLGVRIYEQSKGGLEVGVWVIGDLGDGGQR